MYLMQTISSQRYLNDATVGSKRADHDYTVYYVNVELAGCEYRVVVDGHHSLAAAMADGVEADWTHATAIQADVDGIGADQWLLDHQHDADWYDVATGINVW